MHKKDSIRNATVSDVPAIAAIAERARIKDEDEGGRISRQGFLVSGYSEEKYQKLVDEADIFYVHVDEKQQVTGFLVAYTRQNPLCSSSIETFIRDNYKDNFIIIKQIVVDRAHARKGIASRLYDELLRHRNGKALLAAVVKEPFNLGSMLFHKKRDFSALFEMTAEEDGRKRSVWHLPVSYFESNEDYFNYEKPDPRVKVVDFSPEGDEVSYEAGAPADRLLSFHESAIGLYCHEDNLNWVKVGSLMTLVLFLWAGFGYFLENPPEKLVEYFQFIFLTVVGLVIHLVYDTSLQSGIRYMSIRKETVIKIEERLFKLDTNLMPIVSLTNEVSTTVQWLKYLPKASMAIWVVVCVATLIFDLFR